MVLCYHFKFLMIDDGEDGSKSGHGRRGYLQEGAWDAIHVIEVDIIYCSKQAARKRRN